MAGKYVVRPCCDIDLSTIATLRAQWIAAIGQHRPDCFVVDLSQVGFVSSGGARLIAETVHLQRDHGGCVLVLGANGVTRRLLNLLDIDRAENLELRASRDVIGTGGVSGPTLRG